MFIYSDFHSFEAITIFSSNKDWKVASNVWEQRLFEVEFIIYLGIKMRALDVSFAKVEIVPTLTLLNYKHGTRDPPLLAQSMRLLNMNLSQ